MSTIFRHRVILLCSTGLSMGQDGPVLRSRQRNSFGSRPRVEEETMLVPKCLRPSPDHAEYGHVEVQHDCASMPAKLKWPEVSADCVIATRLVLSCMSAASARPQTHRSCDCCQASPAGPLISHILVNQVTLVRQRTNMPSGAI